MTKEGIKERLDDAYDLISNIYQEIKDLGLREEISIILKKIEILDIELRKEDKK